MRYYLFILIHFFSFSQEKIEFLSKNPFSFKDIITDLSNQENQLVYGILKMPDNFDKNNLSPLIIAVAGSNGWADHHYEYLELYRENGIATFELCSFKSRGINSTVGSQVKVTTAMMILDVYMAFETLANHPMINKEKIAITGWSLGGGVALFSAWGPLKNSINPNISFAAHLPFYPPCIVSPTNLDFGNSPIHILIGELDNWTPAEACTELLNKLGKESNIRLTIYPNSHHSFDAKHPVKIKKNGYILENCRFVLKEDGRVLMNFLNLPMTTPFLQKIGISLCAKRGPKYGRNEKTKKKSLEFAKEFMTKHLLNSY